MCSRRSDVARAWAFDINETLLDLRALDPVFESAFGRAGIRQQWFGQLLQSALVATVTDAYSDFGSIGRAALDMVAARNDVTLQPEQRDRVFATMRSLPPYPEVPSALQRLRATGTPMVALANSTEAFARDQLSNAGLVQLFDQVLSADAVKRLKPAREPYEMAARELGVAIGDMRLVAAHAWDIAGALRAGASAAFVARPGMVLDPLAPRPDIVGADLAEVADRLMAVDLASTAASG
jgi:2-haloacid dehalogenase